MIVKIQEIHYIYVVLVRSIDWWNKQIDIVISELLRVDLWMIVLILNIIDKIYIFYFNYKQVMVLKFFNNVISIITLFQNNIVLILST